MRVPRWMRAGCLTVLAAAAVLAPVDVADAASIRNAGVIPSAGCGHSAIRAGDATITTESGGGYSERGLLGLAVSPTFARDRYVYAFHSNADRSRQSIVRWKDCGGEGTEATVIVELPGGSDCCHKGGRLAFGPDGKLFVTLSEQHVASAAQDTSDVRGKVLRYNADGSVPADNPFGNAV